VLLVLATEVHAAFRLELIPEEYRRPIPPGSENLSVSSFDRWQGGEARSLYWPSSDVEKMMVDQNVKKLPQGARDVRLSKIYLDFVNPILVAVYAREEKGPLDAIVFDLNGDGDLTNDPEFAGFADERYSNRAPNGPAGGYSVRAKEIDYPIPTASPCKVKVILREFEVLIQTNLWLRGKSVLNGQEYDTVIECGNGDPATRRIQLDLNQDGKFKPFHTGWTWMGEYYSRSSQTEFRLPQILWQGVLYEGVFDKTQMELIWTRCPQGRLDLKFKTRQKITGWSGVFTDSGRAWKIFADSDRDPQIVLKAGENVHFNAQLYLKTETGKGMALVDFSSDPPLTIRDGETTPLTIGKASAEIIVRQMGTTVFVNNAFRVKNGLVRTHENGRIVIRDSEGQQLAKGEIKTIKGGEPHFYWNFPSTLKKGDKFKVLVTGESFLFGKFEVEKECVLGDPDSTTFENL
jgi:hypothetical protein